MVVLVLYHWSIKIIVITDRDINLKCPGIPFTFPRGNFTFDVNKLIINEFEKKEYDLTKTSIIFLRYIIIDSKLMMNIANQISKTIKAIPKDKCVSSYSEKESGSKYINNIINGVVYSEETFTDWKFAKSIKVYRLEDVDDKSLYNKISHYIYTRDGIDGYFIREYNFKFNKYINDTGAYSYKSIYDYYIIIL